MSSLFFKKRFLVADFSAMMRALCSRLERKAAPRVRGFFIPTARAFAWRDWGISWWYGYVAPGEQTEFFVSGRTIGEYVENKSHIARSDNKEAHLAAASIFDQLWEASQEGIRRKPKKGMPKDEQIKWVHERYAFMKTKKAFYRVKMAAFEYEKRNNDNLLYDIKVTKSGDLSKSRMR